MKLPEGWYEASEKESKLLGVELKIEMIFGHVLYEKNLQVIAHRDGASDDVLCKVLDEQNSYAVVHLTWRMKPEINTDHPSVELIGSYADFIEYESKFCR